MKSKAVELTRLFVRKEGEGETSRDGLIRANYDGNLFSLLTVANGAESINSGTVQNRLFLAPCRW